MEFNDIVVPVDFSECSKAAVTRAVSLAERFGGRVHLIHAVSPIPYPPEFGYGAEVLEDVEARAALHLSRWAQELREAGREVTDKTVLGPAVDAIQRAVEDAGADLVVMGTHGHTGIKHAFLGSVAARTLRVAPCPVWTVHGEGDASAAVRRVLVPTDFSPHSDHALEAAISFCKTWGAELSVVHVFQSPLPLYAEVPTREEMTHDFRESAKRRLDEALGQAKAAGLDGAARLLEGECAAAIAECARNHGIDLILLGTRANRGIKRAFLGSVAERVVRTAPCSVLTMTLEHDDRNG